VKGRGGERAVGRGDGGVIGEVEWVVGLGRRGGVRV